MSPPRRQEEILRQLLDLPAAERSDCWRRLIELHPEIGDTLPEIAQLISGMDGAGAGPSRPPAAPLPIDAARRVLEFGLEPSEQQIAGTRIGRYKLLQKLGEGGFGAVWMAEQEDPISRRVAIKVIKVGMDTEEVIARFEAERQALALMDHPNIARVFDAGATAGGRPYFVMELVRGAPITKYCDENHLTPTARLELFIKVCEAVQHAHQKGIIHRDLKPSNILVTLHDGVPVPKVIDFGIAKATGRKLTERTLVTQFHAFVGTPVYSSPEQMELSALDVDTRSDIYSLGVLLYELLAGRPPFDPDALIKSGLEAMRHMIREVDPPRPSHRLNTLPEAERTTVAGQRSTDPVRLALLLRGDLDWIVMRCLEKDRTRRYDSASGLAADVVRHLHDEPVVASPPSRWYRFRKLARRNRGTFVAVSTIAATLAIGAFAATWQAVRARHAEREQTDLRVAAEHASAKATAERVRAEAQRQRAEAGELAARRSAYAGDMRWAEQALAIEFQTEARATLDRHRPRAGQMDLRGWEWRYLWQSCQSEGDPIARIVLEPTTSIFTSLSSSADGRWLAATRITHPDVKLWDLRTQQEAIPLAGDPKLQPVIAVFAPHAPLLAVVSEEAARSSPPRDRITLWNVATRQVVRQWTLAAGCARALFSSDGEQLLTLLGGERNQFTVWQVSNGQLVRQQTLPLRVDQSSRAMDRSVAVDPQWRFVAAASRDGVHVVDLATRETLWTNTGPAHVASAAEFSPDGRLLAVAEGAGVTTIKLWDVSRRREVASLAGHHGMVRTLLFSPDGKRLASGCTGQTVRLWDTGSGELLRIIRLGQPGTRQIVHGPNGSSLLVSTAEGILRVNTTGSPPPNPHVQLSGPFLRFGFAMDGRSVITVDRDGNLVRWHGPGWQEREPIMNIGRVINNPVWTPFRAQVRFARGRPWLAKRGMLKGTVEVWDWERRAQVRTLATPASPAVPEVFLDGGRRLLVRYFSTDPLQCGVYEWDLDKGVELRKWPVEQAQSAEITVSIDERACVLGPEPGIFVNLVKWAQRPAPSWEMGGPAALSPDGTLCAMRYLRHVDVRETGQFERIARLTGYIRSPRPPVFSPDGQRLAVDTGKITLFDVQSWERVLTLTPATSTFSFLEFSPDGAVLGNLSDFGMLDLWRAPSWAQIEAAEERLETARGRLAHQPAIP